MARRKELPHIIHRNLSHDAMTMAIQQNFDHLIGEVDASGQDAISSIGSAVAAAETALMKAIYGSTGSVIQDLNNSGVGPEDGSPPAAAPTGVTVLGGFSVLYIHWTGVVNNSPVTYSVHVSTTNNFTPDDTPPSTTLVGTYTIPGGEHLGTFTLRTFPDDHTINGSPVAGTTYYVKVVAEDDSGIGPYSAQGSGTPAKALSADEILALESIDHTVIADDSITTPKLATGAVTAAKIEAGTITATEIASSTITGDKIAGTTITGDKIAAATITAEKMNVGTLAAISATMGSITSGTLDSVTITGATLRTSSVASGHLIPHLRLVSGGILEFYGGITGGYSGSISGISSGGLGTDSLLVVGGDCLVEAGNMVWVGYDSNSTSNKLRLRNVGSSIFSSPPTGNVDLLYDASSSPPKLWAINSGGTARELAAF